MRSSPRMRGPAEPIQCSASIVGRSSITYDSLSGLPCSRDSSSAISSIESMITCAVRRM